jgi:hypothetical protein
VRALFQSVLFKDRKFGLTNNAILIVIKPLKKTSALS